MPYCTKCGAPLPDSSTRYCPACGAAVSSPQTISRSFKVSAKPTVTIDINTPGSLTVNKAGEGEAAFDAEIIDPEVIDYHASQDGNNIKVICRARSWNPLHWAPSLLSRGPRVNIVAKVPYETDLNVTTVTDPIEINGVKGRISSKSTTGSIRIVGCEGPFDLRCQTGQINIEDSRASVNARTTTGKITFSGVIEPSSTNSFSSTTGGIDIAFKGKPDARIDFSTTVGSISCSLEGSNAIRERGEFIGERFSCILGSGSATLRAETTVGSISIHG